MSSTTNDKVRAWGLVPLRMVVATVFLMHGGQKVFDFGVHGVADMLGKLGFPMATFFAVLLMVIECAGGIAILVGFMTRFTGFVLAVEMLIAIYVARLGGGFFTPYGFEFEFTLLGACATLAMTGAGGMSIDAGRGPAHSAVATH